MTRDEQRAAFIRDNQDEIAGIVLDAMTHQRHGELAVQFMRLSMTKIQARLGCAFDKLIPASAVKPVAGKVGA